MVRKWRDLKNFYENKLRGEARKIAAFPLLTESLIKVAERDERVRMVIGIGDMFSKELGHLSDYNNWLNKYEKSLKKNIKIPKPNEENYQKYCEAIDAVFERPGSRHVDYDFILIVREVEDKGIFRDDFLDVLKEESEKNSYIRRIVVGSEEEEPIFNGYDLYEHGIWDEKEFKEILDYQYKIVKDIPSDKINPETIKSKSVPKTKIIPEGLRMYTESGVPLKVTKVSTYLEEDVMRSGTRGMFIKVEPASPLTDLQFDVFESGRGTELHKKGLLPELEKKFEAYRKLRGLPRKKEDSYNVFYRYVAAATEKKVWPLKIPLEMTNYSRANFKNNALQAVF